MRLKKVTQLGSAIVLSVAAMLAVGAPNAFAASKSWIGTDCTGGTPNCNWSDVNNWTGSVVPVNGDSVTFDLSTLATGFIPVNDILNLNVVGIDFTNVTPNAVAVDLGTTLTLSGPLTVAASAATGLGGLDVQGTITLGADVTVTGSGGVLTLGLGTPGVNDKIVLGGHVLTLVDTSAASGSGLQDVAINDLITGSGTVTYNGAATQFDVTNNNTYSGTTNVVASSTWVGGSLGTQDKNPFGTSSIVVSSSATIAFLASANMSVSNPISLAGTSAASNIGTAISFKNSGSSALTFTVPAITLLGNVRLSNDPNVSVNVTGIVANGHCIEYDNFGTLTNTPYTGGPAACVIATTAAKAPKTGLASTVGQPAAVLAAAIAAAFTLFVVARRLKTVKN